MIAALTGMGLSAAAGLNAYIPFIIVALLARFTDAFTLPVGFEWMGGAGAGVEQPARHRKCGGGSAFNEFVRQRIRTLQQVVGLMDGSHQAMRQRFFR